MEDANILQEELWQQTEFAALCSFFNKFGSALGFKPFSFPKLESLFVIDSEGNATSDLVDLHLRLMRKLGLKVHSDKWEIGLLRFLGLQPWLQKEFLQVERFGYGHSPLSMRLCILKNLCERQFDLNLKFKDQVSAQEVGDLRVLPVGADRSGQVYWYQLDAHYNVRVYCEEPDDKSGSTWTIRAKNRDDVQSLISSLKGEELVKEEKQEVAKPLEDKSNQCEESPKPDPSPDEKAEVQPHEAPQVKEEQGENGANVSEAGSSNVPVVEAAGKSQKKERKEVEKEGSENRDILEEKPAAGTSETAKNDEISDNSAKPETESEAPVKPVTAEASKPVNDKITMPFGKSKKGSFLDAFQPSLKPAREKQSKAKHGSQSGTKSEQKAVEESQKSNETSMDESSQASRSNAERVDDSSLLEEVPLELLTPSRRVMPDRRAKLKALSFTLTPPSSSKKGKTEPHNKEEKTALPGRSSASGSDSDEASNLDKVKDLSDQESDDNGNNLESEFEDGDMSDHTDDDEYQAPRPRNNNNSGTPKKRRKAKGSDDEERTPKKKKKAEPSTYCEKCGKKTNPEQLLLCDSCDDAWHTWCLNPSLWYIPDEDWFCPVCQEKMLVEKLVMALETLDEALKKRLEESTKKVRQDELLKRELEYVGITVNNIMEDGTEGGKKGRGSRKRKVGTVELGGEEGLEGLESSESEASAKENSGTESDPSYEDDDEERRRERRRKKEEARRKRRERKRARYDSPPPPIAKSRTRREVKHIDYSFKEFDTMIEEAMEPSDSVGYVKPSRPSGIGRGKDMANIMEAAEKEEQKQRADNSTAVVKTEEDGPAPGDSQEGATGDPLVNGEVKAENKSDQEDVEEEDPVARRARPPGSHMPEGTTVTAAARRMSQKKHRHRLTDLDVDNLTESEEEEYKDSGGSEYEEPSEPSNSDSDYEELRPSRRSARIRGKNARTQSDDDFVVSGSDGSSDSPRKKKVKRKPRRNSPEDSDSDSDSGARRRKPRKGAGSSGGDSSDSDYGRKKKKKQVSKKSGSKKSSQLIVEGRRTRGKRIDYKAFEDGDELDQENAEPVEAGKEGDKPVAGSPVGGSSPRSASATRMRGMPPTAPAGAKLKKKGHDDSDSDVYRPDPSEESEESEIDEEEEVPKESKSLDKKGKRKLAEDSEEAELDESQSEEEVESPKKGTKKKRVIDSEESDDEGQEDLEDDANEEEKSENKTPVEKGEQKMGAKLGDGEECENEPVSAPLVVEEMGQTEEAAPLTSCVDVSAAVMATTVAVSPAMPVTNVVLPQPAAAFVTAPSSEAHVGQSVIVAPPAASSSSPVPVSKNSSIAALETMINRGSPKQQSTPELPRSPASGPPGSPLVQLQPMKPASPLVAGGQPPSAFAPPPYSSPASTYESSPPCGGVVPRPAVYRSAFALPVTQPYPGGCVVPNQPNLTPSTVPPPQNRLAEAPPPPHKPVPYHHSLPPPSYASSTQQPPPHTMTGPIMSSAFAPPPQKAPFALMPLYRPQVPPTVVVSHPSLLPPGLHHAGGIVPPPVYHPGVPRFPPVPYPRYPAETTLPGTTTLTTLTTLSPAEAPSQSGVGGGASESLTDVLSFAIENN